MKLSKRLQMVASFVKKGSTPVDIGTDHAYLPAYLILNAVCESATAADIGKGPLLNAEQTVLQFDLEDRIKLVLSDGLKSVDLDTVDTIILAGMGGDLIKNILAEADKEKLRKKHIIAQPQSHAEKVRLFLIENGFEIEREDICEDAKHTYICMSAHFAEKKAYPENYEYYGRLIENENSLVKKYFENQIFHMRKKYEAIIKIDPESIEAKKLSSIIETTEKIIGEK